MIKMWEAQMTQWEHDPVEKVSRPTGITAEWEVYVDSEVVEE